MKIDKRARLKEIFSDTMDQISKNMTLSAATKISISNTRFYAAEDYPSFEKKESSLQKVTVTKHSTFEAAKKLHESYPDKRIAVLNFASATNPGGGVVNGSSAQEEALCRCSTLYPTLTHHTMWTQYYLPNREEHNVLHNDACIYSPDIVVFKNDSAFPQMMPSHEWFSVDVISCAAPNLRRVVSNQYNTESGEAVKIKPEDLYQLHLKRARHILTIAAANKVDIIILGAFGCGAFENDPVIVSEAMFKAADEFTECFDLIEFAVYCRPYETKNYQAFLDARDRRINLD